MPFIDRPQPIGSTGSPLMVFATPRVVDALVFLLLLSGPPKLRVRDATASLRGESDAAIVLRLAVWGCALIWLLVRLYPVLVARGIVPRVSAPQVVAGLMLVVLSIGIWIAPGKLFTAFSVYQLAAMLVFCWVFARLYGPETYVRYLWWGYLLLALAIIGAWAFMPELVIRRDRLRGDLIAPAGAVAAMGLMLCLSGAIKLRTWVMLPVAGLFTLILVAAQTRTAFVAFALCLGLGWLFRYPSRLKKVLPFAVVLVLLAGVFDILGEGRQYVIRNETSVETMSDRVPLWEHLVGTMLRESPMIGLGYYSASRVLGPQYNTGLGNAHSAFVEVLVGGGLAGGLLFLVLYVVLFVYVIRLFVHGRDDPLVLAVLGLFLITFVMSITNSDGIHGGPVGFTFWSVTALLPTLWNRIRFQDAPVYPFIHAPPVRRFDMGRSSDVVRPGADASGMRALNRGSFD